MRTPRTPVAPLVPVRSSRSAHRRLRALLTAVLVVGLLPLAAPALAASAPPRLLVSGSSDREDPVALTGSALSGDAYVFVDVPSPQEVREVRFHLDGRSVQTERKWHYDFRGTHDRRAVPWSTRDVADGEHVITAVVVRRSGQSSRLESRFVVDNEPQDGVRPSSTEQPGTSGLLVSGTAGRTDVRDARRATVTGTVWIHTARTAGVREVTFAVNGSFVNAERHAPYDLGGTRRGFDTTTLAEGGHTVTVVITHDDGTRETFDTRLTVVNTTPPPAPEGRPATPGACPDGEWEARYYANTSLGGDPAVVRCEQQIDYRWGLSAPADGVPADSFSVRWTGRHHFDGGRYRFRAAADDGIRVKVADEHVLERWSWAKAPIIAESDIAAGSHEVVVEHYEGILGAGATLDWERMTSPTPTPTPNPAPTPARVEAVVVPVGKDLEAVVEANEPGTTFLLESGVHRGQSVAPKDGMTFVGQDGAVLDGGGRPGNVFHGVAKDVTLRNLEIRGYANPVQRGAIQGEDLRNPSRKATAWVLEDLEVHDNGGYGIVVGERFVVRRSHVHHNGQLGIGGARVDDVVVEDNIIHHNNTDGANAMWEAGGVKITAARRLVLRDNHVYDNDGPGLWCDISCDDTLYEGNLVERHFGQNGVGIYHEISGAAVIRNNTVRDCGLDRPVWLWGAGILVSASHDVEVHHNTVVDCDNFIVGIQQSRDEYGTNPTLEGLWVHDNRMERTDEDRAGGVGVVQDIGDRSLFERDLRWERNTYIGVAPDAFWWDDARLDWKGWRAAGQDRDSEWRD